MGESRRGRTLGPISVAVCNYNGVEHLPPCLTALTEQERTIDELFVVDNRSTDASRELLARDFPDVAVVEMDANRGPCPARNRALREAAHDWVLLVDNDAVLLPDVLAKLEAALCDDDGAVLAQPRSVFADDPNQVHYDGGALHYVGLFALKNFYTPLAAAEGAGVVEAEGAVSVALLCHRPTLLAAGGFDETYFILFEDLDLSYRLRSAGHKLLSVEDAHCHHRGGTAGISFRAGDYPVSRTYLHARNRPLYVIKCYRGRTLLLIAPGLVAYAAAELAFALVSGNLGGWLRGKTAFLKGLAGALERRRAVQRDRKLSDRELLVGGPLTVSPNVGRAGAGLGARALDSVLRITWALVRRWC